LFYGGVVVLPVIAAYTMHRPAVLLPLCDRLFELPYGNGMPSIGCGEACDLVFRQA
jgi:hypothetical protein